MKNKKEKEINKASFLAIDADLDGEVRGSYTEQASTIEKVTEAGTHMMEDEDAERVHIYKLVRVIINKPHVEDVR